MEKLKKVLFVLAFVSSIAKAQPAALLDLEFSNNLTNTGTSAAILPASTMRYTSDRQNFTNCAISVDRNEIKFEANDLIFAGKTSFAISTWFRIKNNGYEQYIISTSGYSISIGQGCISAFGTWGCSIQDYYNSAGTLTKWYHLVLSVSLDSSKLYLDSKLVGKSSRNSIVSASNTISLFKDFTGSIDNLKIFKTQLSVQEISNLYNETSICNTKTSVSENAKIENTAFFENDKIHFLHCNHPKILVVFDISGKEVFRQTTIDNNIDLGFLPSNIYVANVITDNSNKRFKFFKW